MWERVEIDLPPDVAAVTTSVWRYPGIMLIGVMRKNFLSPPVVWGQPIKTGLRNLRVARDLVTEWQEMLATKIIYAEAELKEPRNQALLLFLGFEEVPSDYDRKLYQRSI